MRMRYSAVRRNSSGRPASTMAPQDGAADVAHAAQNEHRQRQQRNLRIEGLMIDVGIEVRRDRPADARAKPAERERQRFVAIQTNPIGSGGDVIIANSAKGAAEMRRQKPRLHETDDFADRQRRNSDRVAAQAKRRKDEKRAERGGDQGGGRDGQMGLVPLHSDYDSLEVWGYARPILARALSVVNIHLMRAPPAFLRRSQATISRRSRIGSSILRSRLWPRKTPTSISTMLSQLACLGV